MVPPLPPELGISEPLFLISIALGGANFSPRWVGWRGGVGDGGGGHFVKVMVGSVKVMVGSVEMK